MNFLKDWCKVDPGGLTIGLAAILAPLIGLVVFALTRAALS
jgi:hypothetical protein